MRWLFPMYVLVLALGSIRSPARADCPAGAPPHDVTYMCTAEAPYLDHIGVCVVEDTGYYCGTSCTVCFCGSSFSLRTPCPAVDGGQADAGARPDEPCNNSCGPCSGAAAEGVVLPLAPLLALLGGWGRRRARASRVRLGSSASG